MSPASPYSEALSRCEAELQRLASDAMAKGAYVSARLGLELAEKIADLQNRDDMTPAKPATQKTIQASRTAQKSKPKSIPKPSSGKSATAKSYPKFAREDDKLVKIGWSKRTREEYQHKAPRSAVDAFIGHLNKHTQSGDIFKIDDLLPVPDPANEGDLPAYQVYLVLAWLRSIGSVDKHGRDGYSAKPSALTKKSLAQAWNQLPIVRI